MPKKLTERWQLERFLESYGDLPNAEIIESENPDFVIISNSDRIGVEVTQLYRQPDAKRFPLRAIEAFRESLIQRAREIYTERGAPTVDVGVLFSDNLKGKQDHGAVAERLAAFVQRAYPAEKSGIVISSDDIDIKMPDELEMVRIMTERSGGTGFWSMSQSGLLPNLDGSLLQKAFDAKNSRLTIYREKAQLAWLIIVLDPFYLSSSFSVPEDVVAQTYRSDFDRAFLFSVGERKSWPLGIQPKRELQSGANES